LKEMSEKPRITVTISKFINGVLFKGLKRKATGIFFLSACLFLLVTVNYKRILLYGKIGF